MHENIVLLLKQLSLALEQYGRERMKKLDISPSQSLALDYLFSKKGHAVYATELHDQFGISKPAISSILKELKKKGYVETLIHPEDDRKKQIVLTEKAYLIEKPIKEGLAEQQNRLCRKIPPEQREIIKEGLRIMLDNLTNETPRRNSMC